MHHPLRLVLAALLLAWLQPARAEQGLVNCEAFSSGFTTPDGCIDGSQPSSGPIPTDQPVVEGIADDWPDGEIGPEAGIEF
ncbi:hypothetical protein SynA1825c_01482 [Synechococcus sp. A18-25c]|uniref:hypothetical protein n=1 Tax=Synechococcus sp. A18-25c TaxID=1866938 RepID=UPI001647A8EB|nr:hypothetical protein [Synechococcus sp. A18-25c]QNJ19788.1 hypothetical protein SynA1825c_01482 [Synechococcus sp. A18-25c]